MPAAVTVDTHSPADLQEVVNRAVDITAAAVADNWQTIDQLSELEDLVFIKNSELLLVHANSAFTTFFSPEGPPVGRTASSFLSNSIVEASRRSDEMIAAGIEWLEFEHIGIGADGQCYRFLTHKQSLARFGSPGIAMLGVSRLLEAVPNKQVEPRLDIADKHRRFRALDEVDRRISQQLANGEKVREIADSLNLTSRAVEQRKKKILSTLELDKTLELVKLLVRMQDQGFIDLGL